MKLDHTALAAYLLRRCGTAVQLVEVRTLGGDTTGAAALKAFGYGRPLYVAYRPEGVPTAHAAQPDLQQIVLRQVTRNGFGRERDADRIAEVWLDFATFNALPRHVVAQDIVALTRAGELESAAQVEDFLLVTDYADGKVYADDLLRLRDTDNATDQDHARVVALADYLAEIHAVKHDDPLLWRRRLRDLVGHGEGVMGLADSYPPEYPVVPAPVLQEIEAAANAWRWRLKPLTHRLSQVHGDFHPFNVLFTGSDTFTLLDRSRGAWGEPADDVSCMAINYLFFALQRHGTLAGPCADLYTTFWSRYLERSQDDEMLAVIQPWFAWRALVLASPQWYPTLSDDVRRKLITFARNVLDAQHFTWQQTRSYLAE